MGIAQEKRKKKRSLFHKFFWKTDGAMSIEFSLIAPVFFAFIFSAFEAGLMYTKIATVELAMADVTRQIYTGQAQNNNLSNTQVVQLFCDELKPVIKCDNNVTVEVNVLGSYIPSANDTATCRHTGQEVFEEDLPQYSTSTGGDIVYVRFCVTTDVIVPALKKLTFSGVNIGLQLPETESGKYAIITSTVFRNEPFNTGGGS